MVKKNAPSKPIFNKKNCIKTFLALQQSSNCKKHYVSETKIVFFLQGVLYCLNNGLEHVRCLLPE
jgi:hypothetical protein